MQSMRTAIYVYAPNPQCSIELVVSNDAVVTRYATPTTETPIDKDGGTCVLSPGIYKVVSGDPPQVRRISGVSVGYDVVAVTNDKDPWPDPPARFLAAFSDVSVDVLRNFLPPAADAFGGSADKPAM
jgi:hypothetical protein